MRHKWQAPTRYPLSGRTHCDSTRSAPDSMHARQLRCAQEGRHAITPVRLLLTTRRLLLAAAVPALFALITGCASETLFQSQFNANPVGAPPPAAQAVGTLAIAGAAGSVVVTN